MRISLKLKYFSHNLSIFIKNRKSAMKLYQFLIYRHYSDQILNSNFRVISLMLRTCQKYNRKNKLSCPGFHPTVHISCCCHASLIFFNLEQFPSVAFGLLTFLEVYGSVILSCPSIWVCLVFPFDSVLVICFQQEYHKVFSAHHIRRLTILVCLIRNW